MLATRICNGGLQSVGLQSCRETSAAGSLVYMACLKAIAAH